MNRSLAALGMLVAAAAAGAPAPVIDASALKGALEQGTVKVANIERHLGPPDVPEGAFARGCRSWKLTEAQVLAFFARATAISPEELHTSFPVVPCQFSGAITIDGAPYTFSINAGHFGFIRGKPGEPVALFGCDAACKDLFRIDLSDGT
ncbi:MAG TPA: hypothetical protein VJQ52_22890 [Steroidobacteraceae bacterium]|nr:hypothetical protein [Steroidobacteraceae bacterium]